MNPPNVLVLMTDQLSARVLSAYGGQVIETPNIDRLAAQGRTFDRMISTNPVCTPFRSMWLTGRYPQSTGHLINFVRTRHDEIGWGDVFARGGYDTGYIGKWHLHTGSFPQIDGADFVPEGRDRLGFRWWRGYNFHMDYFNGTVNLDDWKVEQWDGYETDALNGYVWQYLDHARQPDKPFCLLVNPHQPHATLGKFAPDSYYGRLPNPLPLPPNYESATPDADREKFAHYLAMILAVDDMLGELLDGLEARSLAASTMVVLGSDHGTNLGAHGFDFWSKKAPWEESLHVPLIVRWPGVFAPGTRSDVLTGPVDLLPTFCGLCGLPVPQTVEGRDLSAAWHGDPHAETQEDLFIMNIGATFNHLVDGADWRGVRTPDFTYVRYHDGKEMLFDLIGDPQQRNDLIGHPDHAATAERLRRRLADYLHALDDRFPNASEYRPWFDSQRRVIANAHGPLGSPEAEPDWRLLTPGDHS